ncbi:uncharacterized protein LOC118076168 [Zootoca vivipara]|uniref:uncharacterized protein LOC118076168 n=1 Tax=Zootoca vivipara TaxID=8524 RepID=UPI001592A5AA|nr:uncharacterized protein LOC118076168 [Zootoca vivipara]
MMIGVAFFWAFLGMASAVPISSVHSWVNETVQLPFSLQPPSPPWEFLHITWNFITGNRNALILAYLLDKCNGTALKWWEKECYINKQVAEMYRQRADVLKNGTLVLYRVGLHDTGMYRTTIITMDFRRHATVNLKVTEGMTSAVPISTAHSWVNQTEGAGSLTQEKLSTENMVRMVLGGLLLFFLGVMITFLHSGWKHHSGKEDCGPSWEIHH